MQNPYHGNAQAAVAAPAAAAQDDAQPRQHITAPKDHSIMRSPSQGPDSDQDSPYKSTNFEEPIDEANTQGGLPMSVNSDASKAPVSNAAVNAEATPSAASKAARIAFRVTQLKDLLREQGDEYAAHIRSERDLEEFEEAMELVDLDDQRSHLSDGYPETEDGFAHHCHELFNAMKNLVDIDETVAVPTNTIQETDTSAKESPSVSFIKSKNSIKVNMVAGKLMRAMRKAQLGRLSLLGRKMKEYENFTLRFRAVVNALALSKLLVKSAFEGDDWIIRIAINPDAERRRKRLNKKTNDVKSEKQSYATTMKKKNPNLNFKDATKTSDPPKAPTLAAAPSPAAQAQQSSQGSVVSSPRRRMSSDSSSASRSSKRVKTSQEEQEQPETAAALPSSENNTSQYQQLAEGQTGPAASYPSAGIPSHAGQSGGSLAGGRGAEQGATYAQSAMLSLDPNPLHVPGPLQQYVSEPYVRDDAGFFGQSRSGWAGLQDPQQDESQQTWDEDDDLFRYGG